MKTFATAKIHGLQVTDARIRYEGSISLPPSIMDAAGIEENEQVHVNGYLNGSHWITYAIRGQEGRVQVNGPPVHHFGRLEEIVVVRYELLERQKPRKLRIVRAGETDDDEDGVGLNRLKETTYR